MNLRHGRIKKDRSEKRERLIVSMVADALFVGLLIAANFFLEKNTRQYYHAHHAVMILSVLYSLGFIVTRSLVKQSIIALTKKAALEWRLLNLDDWDNLQWGVSFLLAVIGFMTVDISFFENYGLRISAVVGMALFRIMRVAFIK